jgi:plastocyanin
VRRTTVDVGKDSKLLFEPSNVTEPKGTVVNFIFHPKNHSVVQSSFDNPCQPLPQGFSSGFIPASVSPSGVVFEYTVENDKPVWFYCAQDTGKHCQSGMVGAINA